MGMLEEAENKVGHRVLRQERDAFAAAGRSVLDALDDPAASSPRAQDVAWMRGKPANAQQERLQAITAGAVHDAAGLLLSANEHVQALEVVLSPHAMLPIPALTLARAAQEASILFCYLTDPAVPPSARLARVAALRMHTAQENQKTQRLFGDAVEPELARDAAEGVEGLQRYFIDAGFELRYDKDGRYVTSLAFDGQRAPVTPKTTELSAQYIPAAHNSWVIGSGATHSRTWLTQGLEGPWRMLVAAIVLPLLDVADALADALCGYVGHDAASLHKSTHLRRIAIYRSLGHTGPVMSWTDYAKKPSAAVGAEPAQKGVQPSA
jgi:hypothetical protein